MNHPESPITSNPSSPEPCPTPLAWQEVLNSFSEQARSHDLNVPGAELTVWELGHGPAVAFLPGQTGTPLLFALTAWLLREEYRCLLFDHPRWQIRPASVDLLARTAECDSLALEYLAPEGAGLYASQFGCQTALQLMADHPQRVHRAVLQAASANRKFTVPERCLLQAGRYWPGSLGRLPLWQSIQLQNHRRWFPPFDETRFGFLLHEIAQTPVRDASERLLAAARTDLRPRLSEIRQPVLVLHCEGVGQQFERAEQELEESLPAGSGDWMSTTGLFPHLTHPHRLVKILRTFLAEQRQPATELSPFTAGSH